MRKYLKALTNITIALITLLLVIFLVPRVLVFFSPFVAGWVIACIAGGPVRFFEEKMKIKRKAGSAFVIIVVIGLVVLLLYLVGAKLVEEAVGLINSLPVMWESVKADFEDIGRNFEVVFSRLPEDMQGSIVGIYQEVGSYVGEALGKISTPTIAAVGNFAKKLPVVLINVIMSLLSAYFFVAERDSVSKWFYNSVPKSVQRFYDMVKRSLVKAVGGYLKAQLKIEVWMYLLLVIGLSILQVDYVLLIALGIAFLDLLPFFGTGTVMIPWAILKILSADYKMAIWLLIIWGGGQLARQIIQPKIVGDSVGVPPIPTLFLLYTGFKLNGVLGMIIAVPIGLILRSLYEEGMFDTTKESVLLIARGLNRFRRLNTSDIDENGEK